MSTQTPDNVLSAQVPSCTSLSQTDERTALRDLFMMGCKEIAACPPCAMAAALYAAAQTAQKGLEMDEEHFLDAAKEIFQDVQNQFANRIVV